MHVFLPDFRRWNCAGAVAVTFAYVRCDSLSASIHASPRSIWPERRPHPLLANSSPCLRRSTRGTAVGSRALSSSGSWTQCSRGGCPKRKPGEANDTIRIRSIRWDDGGYLQQGRVCRKCCVWRYEGTHTKVRNRSCVCFNIRRRVCKPKSPK